MNIFNDKLKAVASYVTPKGLLQTCLSHKFQPYSR